MRFHTRQLIGVLSIPILLLASCSSGGDDAPVAKVKDRVITLSDFEKAINAVSAEFLPTNTDLSGKLEFLDTMIDRELLAIKADELGYDKDPSVVAGMTSFRGIGLQAGYLRIKIAKDLAPTEKEVKDTHKKFGLVYQVKQILTDTEDEGLHVYDLLQEGNDFESVCRQYSRGPDASMGGKQVAAVFGQFPPHFQDELFNTPVGGFTKPIINRYGYFVIKVVSKSQAPPRPFDEVKSEVMRIANQQRQLRLTYDLSQEIRDKHNFQFYDDALRIVFNALPPDVPITNPPPRSSEVYPLLDLEVGDFDKTVCSYGEEGITLRDFSDLYDRSSFSMRPRRELRLGGIRKFFVDLVMNDLVELELVASGVENEPEVIKMLRKKEEELMVNRLYWELIDQQTEVPNDEIEAYYKDNMERFHVGPRRQFSVILAGDRGSAEEARRRVLAGGDFERVALQFATAEDLNRTGMNHVPIEEGQYPEIDTYGFSLNAVGDISEPFETQLGWAVIKLVEAQPERYKPVQEARHDINHNLKQVKNDERLEELLTKWREEVEITIYEKTLEKADITTRLVPGTRGGGN